MEMRHLTVVFCLVLALPVAASDYDQARSATRVAVETLEAVKVQILPIQYATGKALEDSRQRALKAAGRINKEVDLLEKRPSLEVKFLLTSDLRNLYDAMRDVTDGLSGVFLRVEPESVQERATSWFSALSDASGPLHESMLDLEDQFQLELQTADQRLRECK
jgi:hypothetical protein